MDVSNIVDLMKNEGAVTQYRVPREHLLSGSPTQTLTHRFISPCGQFGCGFWESTPGIAVIPPGFAGTWEVVETCRKVFVSYMPQVAGSPDGRGGA